MWSFTYNLNSGSRTSFTRLLSILIWAWAVSLQGRNVRRKLHRNERFYAWVLVVHLHLYIWRVELALWLVLKLIQILLWLNIKLHQRIVSQYDLRLLHFLEVWTQSVLRLYDAVFPYVNLAEFLTSIGENFVSLGWFLIELLKYYLFLPFVWRNPFWTLVLHFLKLRVCLRYYL